jgi:flagellar hook-basal body complex protein FliE
MTRIGGNINPYAALGAQKAQIKARGAQAGAQNAIGGGASIASQPAKAASSSSNIGASFQEALENVKDMGQQADKSATNFSLGGGSFASTALDTKIWSTTIELASQARNSIIEASKKIMDTPL